MFQLLNSVGSGHVSTVICSASFFSSPPYSEAFETQDVFCVASKVVLGTCVSGHIGGAFGVADALLEAAGMFHAAFGALSENTSVLQTHSCLDEKFAPGLLPLVADGSSRVLRLFDSAKVMPCS